MSKADPTMTMDHHDQDISRTSTPSLYTANEDSSDSECEHHHTKHKRVTRKARGHANQPELSKRSQHRAELVPPELSKRSQHRAEQEGLLSLHPQESEKVTSEDEDILEPSKVEILSLSSQALNTAEELARRMWQKGWQVVHHNALPRWLRDNDFLIDGHRPPLYSVWACLKSIFRIHTETGNIWTHLLGFVAFIAIASYFLTRPSIELQWQEKAVFSAYFAGAILCMGFSWVFHTMYCHSENMGRLFNKLDYCGIAFLTMGSFVPWLYYSFYCRTEPKIAYLVLIFILGTLCIIVSMWDKFAEPKFRVVRAGTFVGLGLSGIIPAMHFVITDGFYQAVNFASLGWLVLMAVLYITGAVIYAARIPERIWPGKFDIWGQSHQIFHVFVIAAALVHFHGISEVANYRLSLGDCLVEA